ncbi:MULTISPECIES: response regulator [Bacillus]|uniref:Two-component response regulator n=1 Tax=Bacillus licheniformis (strain ATCC 14580 / DSM 13 / JCM 2505 / CCUG 7422 / NBRC 12200 / NCIMB 9375 / NCTC 10341 / NRRL NRS-1264 / Gibson 46) TaxID=279010 RepID=Q65P28_BACLD|nr:MULTISPECIES: response regulator [Bacillus]AAU21841.2 two-component response regulator [Bacillus licheniformis DSM 13 = ATCC 14580]AAU39186.1 two-component response regulator CitT [Bacillus licheniformis DSM 13 = ATCC 14580]MBG9696887.1 transcriptional regulator [Bacillus licheniformis]MCR3917435.1 response regulator [Bacillus licheniformis]MDH3165143.1 response regulator [Bacillus licheniformis]
MIDIVIAEDDFRVAQIHERLIEQLDGFNIIGKAANAKETMEILEVRKADLLLLDIYMPDEMGTTLIPVIRKRFPEVDIMIITAATETCHLQESLRAGIVHYLIKPVTAEKFKQVLLQYKKKRQTLLSQPQVSQSMIDQIFGDFSSGSRQAEDLPTGINSITLQKIRDVLRDAAKGMTAEELGEKMGASRTTARRYAEYLVSKEEARAELEYGIIGRPERKYYLADE